MSFAMASLDFVFPLEEGSPQHEGTFLPTDSSTLPLPFLSYVLKKSFSFLSDRSVSTDSPSPDYHRLSYGWYFFSSQPWLFGHSMRSGQPESYIDLI
jgi:hypothetical protein